MDEDIMNAVESLFGKDVKIVDCETSSSVQQEEVLLINGIPVKMDGIPADDASAIKSALLDGQMPAVEHLNQLLFQAGLAQQPIEVETSLTVKSSLTTTEEVLVSRHGQVLDERTVETREHFNHQSHQKEIWQPAKQQSAISRATPERALNYQINSSSTCASQATETENSGSNLFGRQLNHTFSNASMLSTSSAISGSDQVIGSTTNISTSTTIGDKCSNISSCDSGHDGLFHSVSLSAPWSHAARDTQTDLTYCHIPSSTDEFDTSSTLVMNPCAHITEQCDTANDCQIQPAYAKDIPSAGTLDTLILLLTTLNDEEFQFTFILCSRLFLSPSELLIKLANKCQNQNTKADGILLQLLTYWLSICAHDFKDEAMQQTLRKLASSNDWQSDNFTVFVDQISASLGQLDERRRVKCQNLLAKQSSASSLGRQSSIKSLKRFAANVYSSNNLLNVCSNAFKLAHQLYAIEYAYLSQIRPEEFFEILVSGEFKRYLSETNANFPESDEPAFTEVTIASYVQWWNRLSYQVATEILKLNKKSQRVQMIDFWIETALECFNTGNFNSLMAILAALNMTVISRLKKTWAKVQTNKFEGLDHQMNPSSNYLNYRLTMKAAVWRSERESANEIERAIIPFFVLFLKDFCTINESFETKLVNEYINFEKCTLFGTQLRNFYKWQRLDCPYEQSPKIIAYLKNAEIMSEDGLKKASYDCEHPDDFDEKNHYKTLKSRKKSIT